MGMKLGSQVGSVMNHIMSRQVIGQPEPKVGMGASILLYSDRHAASVFRVFKHKGDVAIEVRDDEYKVVSGSAHDGSAVYEFKINVRGRRSYFVFKDGEWRQAENEAHQSEPAIKLKLRKKGQGHGLLLGRREHYYDPSF